MTSFVHTDYPSEHPGVVRAEAFVQSVGALWGNLKASFNTARAFSTVLMAGFIAALVLVADQLVDTWVDGHLFAAWVALWTLVFATLATLAPLIKGYVENIGHRIDAWRERSAMARSDAAYLESAQNDPRVMAELRAAIWRHQAAQIASFGEVLEPIDMPWPARKVQPAGLGHLRYM